MKICQYIKAALRRWSTYPIPSTKLDWVGPHAPKPVVVLDLKTELRPLFERRLAEEKYGRFFEVKRT